MKKRPAPHRRRTKWPLSRIFLFGITAIALVFQHLWLSSIPESLLSIGLYEPRKSIYAVDCATVPMDTEPYFGVTKFPQNKMAIVDNPVWKKRPTWNYSRRTIMHLIQDVQPDEAFIDVGANIGQMTLGALAGGKIIYAFDPLAYDITKICSGIQESLNRGYFAQTEADRLQLYRVLVGNESLTNASVTRPDDAFGKFDQASVLENTMTVQKKPNSYVKEYVPMVTLDEIIPANLRVGLVKIDVQGFEWPVVQGMKGLLERETGYPRIIHYEEHATITPAAGFQLGTVQAFLEGYGYTCQRDGNVDIICKKD